MKEADTCRTYVIPKLKSIDPKGLNRREDLPVRKMDKVSLVAILARDL
jgi:hypothetical protein